MLIIEQMALKLVHIIFLFYLPYIFFSQGNLFRHHKKFLAGFYARA